MSGTEEFDSDILDRIADVSEYLNKRGYILAIMKKPRSHNFVKMYNQKTGLISKQTRFGATKVRDYREAAGLTITALAEDLGVDRNIVKRMERDNLTHTYDSMKRFADYFGCSVEELLADD